MDILQGYTVDAFQSFSKKNNIKNKNVSKIALDNTVKMYWRWGDQRQCHQREDDCGIQASEYEVLDSK